MSILISAQQLTMSFGAKFLFRNLKFTINEGEKIGLIGPNGAGKSTLLKILSQKIKQESGEVSSRKGVRLGYLEQDPQFSQEETVEEYLKNHLIDPDDWSQIAKIYEWLEQIQCPTEWHTLPVSSLSGGWKKKIALIGQFLREPDLMMLDEPTNHLDVESILWLEKVIGQSRCGLLMITHDRAFLQNTCNRIIELDMRHQDGLLSVQGDYAHYLSVRENIILAQERRETVLKNTLRRESEWLARGAKARQTKQVARIQRAEDLKNTIDDLENRNLVRKSEFAFQSSERQTKKLMEAQGVGLCYSDRFLFRNLDLLLTPKSRLGLLGANGSGKSSLIKVLMGVVPATEGVVKHAEQLKVAYLQQDRNQLDLNQSVLKNVCPEGDYVRFQGEYLHIRSYLDRFLFSGPIVDMPVSKLSGGERCRILLAQLMLNECQVLILDEPTNDLDLATQNVLEEALKSFDGSVILVTHDRFFMDQICNQLLYIDADSQAEGFGWFADLHQWENWFLNERESSVKNLALKRSKEQSSAHHSQAQAKGGASSSPNDEAHSTPSDGGAQNSKKSKLSYKENKELESMESDIAAIEAEIAQVESLIREQSSSALLSDWSKQLMKLSDTLEQKFARWQSLDEKSKQ